MTFNIAFPYFPEEDIDEILHIYREILSGNGMLSMGKQVNTFESEFANHIGSQFAVATNSCTSALEIALHALNIGPGDEVIVPCQTFFASGSCIVARGAKPIFVEIDSNFLLDINDLEHRITERTRAVILVHFAGLIHPEIERLRNILSKNNIALIEDAAHAHGAKWNENYAGTLGDLACFSFYSTKIMTTGEGGMITGIDKSLYNSCAGLRNRGMDPTKSGEIFIDFGSNHRFTDLQALLGIYQLKRLEEFVDHRNQLANIYRESLKDLKQSGIIDFQQFPDNIRHSYWRFIIRLKDEDTNREQIQSKMRTKGIPIDWPYTPLLHLQPAFREAYNIQPGSLPYSEQLGQTHFCLPVHALIKPSDAEYIADSLKDSLYE